MLFTSLRISLDSRDLGKSREGNPDFAWASVSSGLLARLTTLIKHEYGCLLNKFMVMEIKLLVVVVVVGGGVVAVVIVVVVVRLKQKCALLLCSHLGECT